MYQLLADLLPWLFAFLVADGLFLLGPGHRILARNAVRWRLLEGRLVYVPPLPWGEALCAWEIPALVTDEAVALFPSDPGPVLPAHDELSWIPFGEAPFRAEDRSVRVGGRTLFRAPSAPAAREAAEHLEELRLAPAAERARIRAKRAERRADLESMRLLRGAHAAATPLLAALATASFTLLFVFLPVSLFSPLGERVDPALFLALFAACWALTLWRATRLLATCGVPQQERRAALLPLLVFPPSAAHALSLTTKDLYGAFEPLAVTASVAPEALAPLIRRERILLSLAKERDAGTPLAASWAEREARVESLAARAGFAPAASEPSLRDPLAAAFCPVCDAGYRPGFRECVDCGVALRPFS